MVALQLFTRDAATVLAIHQNLAVAGHLRLLHYTISYYAILYDMIVWYSMV
jgi:hypothetical protein